VKQAAVPLAGLVAGGSVPLIALTIGWTHAFLLAALMGAVALIPVALCKPGNVGKGQQDRNRSLDRRLVFPFVLMATMTMFAAGAANSAIAFSVTGALEHGMDAGGAGLLLAIGSAAGASIRILAGRVADKTRLEPLPLIRLAMLACAAGLTLMAIPQTWSYIAGFLLASGIGWGWPGLIHYLVSHTAPHAAAEATGIVQTGSYIGSAVGPMVAGVVLGSGTQTMMWLMLATMAAAAVAISYPVRRQIGSRPIDE
jgi:cyanate permease